MGAWGVGFFENDDALDYLQELVEDGVVALREAFEVVLDPDLEDVEAEEGSRAVAAAGVLSAILRGACADELPGAEFQACAAGVNPAELADLPDLARQALSRVLGPESELAELWEDSPDAAAWRTGVEALRAALA